MFERFVVVDWSANNVPKSGADSIWVCTLDARTGAHETINLRTRATAREALLAIATRPGRTLIGFDFPLGYPAGFAAAAGLDGVPWAATWRFLTDALTDDERNRNNRWSVAAELNRRMGARQFWGAPPSRAGEHLTARRVEESLPRFRDVEQRLREGGRYPFSAWQLLGAGSVGSQALTGIPVAHRLRHHPGLAHRVRVWPFETGLVADPTSATSDAIVLAEVWPSAIGFGHVDHPVKDARQVIALAQWLAARDDGGELARLFAPPVDDAATVSSEEGWVLGVG